MRQASCHLPTRSGEVTLYVYGNEPDGPEQVVALVRPGPDAEAVPLVRVHSVCLTGDVFGSLRCDCGPQLATTLQRIGSQDEGGILLYMLNHEGRGIGLARKIRAYALQEQGLNTVEANLAQGLPVDARDYAPAAHVLRDLGVTRLRLATNNPLKIAALEAAGLTVENRVAIGGFVSQHNQEYLHTKDTVMGHLQCAVSPAEAT